VERYDHLWCPSTTGVTLCVYASSDLALAQFNTASRKLRNLRKRTGWKNQGEIILLNGGLAELDALLKETGDTWIVLYFDGELLEGDPNAKSGFQALRRVWTTVARELADVANVAVCDLRGNFTTQPSVLDRPDIESDPQTTPWTEGKNNAKYVADSQHQYPELPCAKFHRGASAAQQPEAFAPDVAGRLFKGSLRDAAGIVKVARAAMAEAGLEAANIASTPVFLRRAYAESLSNFRCGNRRNV
jgi:hypothetical protein